MANALNSDIESITLNTELETPTLDTAAEQEQPLPESTSHQDTADAPNSAEVVTTDHPDVESLAQPAATAETDVAQAGAKAVGALRKRPDQQSGK